MKNHILFSLITLSTIGSFSPAQAMNQLQNAIFTNDYDRTRFLLEHGANANTKFLPNRPLIFVVKTKLFAKLFVEHGANIQRKTSIGFLVHNACKADYTPELLEYYLQFPKLGANCINSLGDTPLHAWAIYSLGISIVKKCHLPDARRKLSILVQAGTILNSRNNCELTALDILLQKRDELVRHQKRYWESRATCDELIQDLRKAMNPELIAKSELPKIDPEYPDKSCSICFDDLADDIAKRKPLFACSHTAFHGSCIQKWITRGGGCPLCRAVMK